MKTTDPEFSTLPEEVQKFCLAVKESALKVEGWDEKFAESLLWVDIDSVSGAVTMCDNFERFFSGIYKYYPDTNKWTIRGMYSDGGERPYYFARAMSDARFMFTG